MREWCGELHRNVTGSYRLLWRWTDTGREWWVEMQFRSAFMRPLFGEYAGRVRVTGLQDNDWHPARRHGRAVVLGWGGSSGDSGSIPPGESRTLVYQGVDPYVATRPDGVVTVEDAGVTVWQGRRWCGLPMPERS